MPLVDLSRILYFSAALHTETEGKNQSRPYPSIGSRYPLELYPIILNSPDTGCGIYHYDVSSHALELVAQGDFSQHLSVCIRDPEAVKNASVVMVVTAVFARSEAVFGDRGYRYVFLEAGHFSQNILFVTELMGLDCHFIGAFIDDDMNELLDIDGNQESTIYLIAIGSKKQNVIRSLGRVFRRSV